VNEKALFEEDEGRRLRRNSTRKITKPTKIKKPTKITKKSCGHQPQRHRGHRA